MRIFKVITGFVTQEFDTDTGKWVSQDFEAGEEVFETDKENADGVFTDAEGNVFLTGDEIESLIVDNNENRVEDLSLEMVQP